MAAPYGDGFYANEPPSSYGLNITDLFHIVEPKPDDPGIESAVDSQYPNVAVITFDKTNQFGGMWANNKLDLAFPFSTEMHLHLGRQYGYSGPAADGMTFVMHNDPDGLNAIGGAGEGLGAYRGRKWSGTDTVPHGTCLKNSLVIEFDTCRDRISEGALVDDPGAAGSAHCSLLFPRSNTITMLSHMEVYNFTPTQDWIKFEAKWTPNNIGGGTLDYSFGGIERVITVDNIISTFADTTVYWGFTGSTGDFTAVQAAAITQLPIQSIIAEKTVKNENGDDIDQKLAHPNDILYYTIRVTTNMLTGSIGPVDIEDELSEHVTYMGGDVKVTTQAGDVYDITPIFVGNTMNIATGQYLTEDEDWIEAAFSVRAAADAGGRNIYNQALISAEGLSEAQRTNSTRVMIFTDPEKTVSDQSEAGQSGAMVKPEDHITYNLNYLNNQETTATVVITDKLSAGLDFVSATNGGIYDESSRTVTWTLANVPAGVGGIVSLVVQVNKRAAVRIENSSTVQAGSDDPLPSNVVVNPVVPKTPKKIVAPDSQAGRRGANIKAEDLITYNITYLNYQETAATVIITDKLSARLDFVSATNGGIYDEFSHTVTWTLADVPSGVGGIVALTVQVKARGVTRIINSATVQVGYNDPLTSNVVVNPAITYRCPKAGGKARRVCRQTITGCKIWVDDDNANETRPDSIEIVLLRDGEEYRRKTIYSKRDGIYIFACLPVWKNSEDRYFYEIEELEVPDNYAKTIEGYNVINTLIF